MKTNIGTAQVGISKPYAYYYHHVSAGFKKDLGSIKDFADGCPPGPILEIGAGTGRIINAKIERDIYLLECSPDMLEILTEQTSTHENVSVLPGDALRIPLSDESVSGVIFLINTVCEIAPSLFALLEARRVLRNDGRMYLAVQNVSADNVSPRGLRQVEIDGASYSYYVETFKTPTFGKHSYQTHLVMRNEHDEKRFIVPQTIPPVGVWIGALELIGFSIMSVWGDFEGNIFKNESSEVAVLTVEKQRQVSCGAFNAPLRATYDKMAGNYDEITLKHNYTAPKWIQKYCAEYVGLSPTVLDLGCGNGLVGRVLVESGVKPVIFGIDYSTEMVAQCRRTGIYRGVLEADLAAGMPISEDMSFDIVTAFGISEFIPNIKYLLSEIKEKLLPGGELWISFEETGNNILPSGVEDPKAGIIKYHYSVEEVESLLEEARLRVVSIGMRP